MLEKTRIDGVASPQEVALGHRMLFAVIGLLACETTITVLVGGQPLVLYFMTTAAIAWAFIGLPVILPLPSRVLSQLPWLVILIGGGCLGPLALAAIFIASASLHALLGPATFSLDGLFAGAELLWPVASLASTVAVGTYSALVRRRYRQISVP